MEQIEGKEPLLTPEDCLLAEEIVKADPNIAAMLHDDYGITDLSLVACDPWSGGEPPPYCSTTCSADWCSVHCNTAVRHDIHCTGKLSNRFLLTVYVKIVQESITNRKARRLAT